MASSPSYGDRPALQGYRRSFTVGHRELSFHERAALDETDANAELLYSHRSARIVSFAPPPESIVSNSSVTLPDTDYPVDTVETLPWRSRTETLAASGPLVIEKVRGSTNFLKSGGVTHAIMRNSQCWCVDGESKFVMRVRKLQYYRIELPSNTEEDKKKVEELKQVLQKLLRFERTPCPFKRAFHVELPDDAITPRRKGQWKRREPSFPSSPGSDPLPLRRTKNFRSWSMQAPSPLASRTVRRGSDYSSSADPDDLLRRQYQSSEDRSMTPSSHASSEDLAQQYMQDVQFETGLSKEDDHDTDGHETEKNEHEAMDLPNIHRDIHTDHTQAEHDEQDDPLFRQLQKDIENSKPQESDTADDEDDSLYKRLKEDIAKDLETDHDDNSETETLSRNPDRIEGIDNGISLPGGIRMDAKAFSNTITSKDDTDKEALRKIVDYTGPDSTPVLPTHETFAHSQDEESDLANKQGQTSHTDIPEANVDTTELARLDNVIALSTTQPEDFAEPPNNELLSNSSPKNDEKLTENHTALATVEESHDQTSDTNLAETPSEGGLSKSTSRDSFHTVGDGEWDAVRAKNESLSNLIKSIDAINAKNRQHKRDVSDVTVTASTIGDSTDVNNLDRFTTGRENQNPSPDSEKPMTPTLIRSSASDTSWPDVQTPLSPTQVHSSLRQRIKSDRKLSPLPSSSNVVLPTSHDQGNHLTAALLQKACNLALVKPIEMVVLLVHIFARIAGGATVNDLMSGDLFKQPDRPRHDASFPDRISPTNSTQTEESEDDEDDFGVPFSGKRKDSDPTTKVEITKDSDTDSMFDLD